MDDMTDYEHEIIIQALLDCKKILIDGANIDLKNLKEALEILKAHHLVSKNY